MRPLNQIVGGIRSLRDYFEQFSREQPLFLPESKVAAEVATLVGDGSTSRSTRDRIRELLETPLGDHHDGAGWHHFHSLVREWLEAAEALDPGGSRVP